MSEPLSTPASADEHNISDIRKAKLRDLFPEAFDHEGGFDENAIKQALGITPENEEKRFGLFWPGKEQALAMTTAPHNFHLVPDLSSSVNFNNTRNVFIEADNLAALRLMQNAYAGRVKLIYIDPPYNTGNDFVYKDDFSDPLNAYLSQCALIDDSGKRIARKTNSETSGRKHSNWLNFMYPRLILARRLLRADGAMIVSCDDNEMPHLRLIMAEIFGEENFIANITLLCNPKGRSHDKHFAQNHEYLIIFSRSPLPVGAFSIMKDESQVVADYPEIDEFGRYRTMDLRNTHREFGKHNRPNLFYPLYLGVDGTVGLNPDHGSPVLPLWDDGFEGCWTWSAEKASKELSLLLGREVNGRTRIYRKSYAEGSTRMLKTIFQDPSFTTEAGQRAFNTLFGKREKLFESPKSVSLLATLIESATGPEDIIFDFFGGSGSTAHAAWLQSAKDGKSRRFIIATLPEPVAEKSEAKKAGYNVVSEITLDRLRLASKEIQHDSPSWNGDAGFRMFRLAGQKPTMQSWKARTVEEITDLLGTMSNLSQSRESDLDKIAYHVIWREVLRAGFMLDASLESRAEDIWRVSQEGRHAFVAMPKREGDLRERIKAVGAARDDEVILIERMVSDSDVANCSAYFRLKTVRI